jgi:fructose-1,6-bisphosphatase/inositol monophosphatase family enzyme
LARAELQLALELAEIADSMAMERFRTAGLRVEEKADGTPVTDADEEIEVALRRLIRSRRPGDAILGEEFGAEGESQSRWYLDPIDRRLAVEGDRAARVEQAGGRFTDLAGHPDPGSGNAIVTNGSLHDQALAVLAGRP